MPQRPKASSNPSLERLLGMPVSRFLRDYWQKAPLLVRGALPDFRDPLTPEELAGLSCEDGVESRVVREAGGEHPWEVTWGPQAESRFATLPDDGWTILVQELNRHVPKAALLLDRFAFIPNVRVDDVMVSYATPGGGVGAHVDSYDVFLVQGMGKRRWMFHTKPTQDVRFVPDLELRILETFVPDVDEVLEPGDMLYIPPGFAHHGVAVTPCLTYSVGFRAPGFGEMWKDFAAASSSRAEGARLLEDPRLTASDTSDPGAIPEAMLARVRETIRGMDTSDEAIDRWFASFATRLGPGRGMEPKGRKAPETSILAKLESYAGEESGMLVARSEEGRWAYLPCERRSLRLYVGGVEIEVPAPAAEMARMLCSRRRIEVAEVARASREHATVRSLIVRLFQMGALRFVRSSRASAR